jgi:hypothetical protein
VNGNECHKVWTCMRARQSCSVARVVISFLALVPEGIHCHRQTCLYYLTFIDEPKTQICLYYLNFADEPVARAFDEFSCELYFSHICKFSRWLHAGPCSIYTSGGQQHPLPADRLYRRVQQLHGSCLWPFPWPDCGAEVWRPFQYAFRPLTANPEPVARHRVEQDLDKTSKCPQGTTLL